MENTGRKLDAYDSRYADKKRFKLFNGFDDNTFSISYISYLSRYSNNIISFSGPKEIYLELNQQNFSSLFQKYVDEIIEITEERPKLKPFEYIKNQFGEKIKKHYDFNHAVTHADVQNLIAPVRIDFAGKNKIDVYAQTVDMEATPATVANQINAFIQLKATYVRNKTSMKDFFIAKEPSSELFPRQHDIWNQLRSSGILNYLDLSESETIITYAEEHGVVPLTRSAG